MEPLLKLNAATCGGRVEIECAALGCSEVARLVRRSPQDGVLVETPVCLECLETMKENNPDYSVQGCQA